MGNYYLKRNNDNISRLREIKNELPGFCGEFFIGIENQTSALTRLNYGYDLRQFFGFLSLNKLDGKLVKRIDIYDLEQLDVSDIEEYLEYLNYYIDPGGKEHVNEERAKSRQLSTIRTLFKYFYNKGKLEKNIAAKVALPKLHTKEIVRLEVDEVVKILDEAENGAGMTENQRYFHNKTKIRDVALLTLFLGTGIRISECVGLNVEDVDFETNAFKVTRKGGNKVILYFSDEVASALRAYITVRSENPETPKQENALFLSLQNKRISVRAVQDLVKKYSRIVSPLKNISPHKLRSTYGTTLYRETHDIYVVAEVLGHKDVNTTKKHYAAISDDIRRNAAKAVKLRED